MRIGLLGYRRVGKDAVTRSLVSRHGYLRRSVGDFIKKDLDHLVRAHFGFTAFTERDEEKEKIRPLLEAWGAVNTGGILQRFYDTLPKERVVNGRVQLIHEAERWVDAGGVFLVITRNTPDEPSDYEKRTVGATINHVFEKNYTCATIYNSGTLEDLDLKVELALRELNARFP